MLCQTTLLHRALKYSHLGATLCVDERQFLSNTRRSAEKHHSFLTGGKELLTSRSSACTEQPEKERKSEGGVNCAHG